MKDFKKKRKRKHAFDQEKRNGLFPSMGSDDPLQPLGVENVKIRENFEQSGDSGGVP